MSKSGVKPLLSQNLSVFAFLQRASIECSQCKNEVKSNKCTACNSQSLYARELSVDEREKVAMVKSGWAECSLDRGKSFQRRYLALLSVNGVGSLYFFTNDTIDAKQLAGEWCAVAISQGTVQPFERYFFSNRDGYQFWFTPPPKSGMAGREFITDVAVFEERDEWLNVMRQQGAKEASMRQMSKAHPMALKEGWLVKLGNVFKSWRRRYFVLVTEPRCELRYFKRREDEKPLGSILLPKYSLVVRELSSKRPHTFAIRPSAMPLTGFSMMGAQSQPVPIFPHAQTQQQQIASSFSSSMSSASTSPPSELSSSPPSGSLLSSSSHTPVSPLLGSMAARGGSTGSALTATNTGAGTRTFYLAAYDDHECQDWMTAVSLALNTITVSASVVRSTSPQPSILLSTSPTTTTTSSAVETLKSSQLGVDDGLEHFSLAHKLQQQHQQAHTQKDKDQRKESDEKASDRDRGESTEQPPVGSLQPDERTVRVPAPTTSVPSFKAMPYVPPPLVPVHVLGSTVVAEYVRAPTQPTPSSPRSIQTLGTFLTTTATSPKSATSVSPDAIAKTRSTSTPMATGGVRVVPVQSSESKSMAMNTNTNTSAVSGLSLLLAKEAKAKDKQQTETDSTADRAKSPTPNSSTKPNASERKAEAQSGLVIVPKAVPAPFAVVTGTAAKISVEADMKSDYKPDQVTSDAMALGDLGDLELASTPTGLMRSERFDLVQDIEHSDDEETAQRPIPAEYAQPTADDDDAQEESEEESEEDDKPKKKLRPWEKAGFTAPTDTEADADDGEGDLDEEEAAREEEEYLKETDHDESKSKPQD